MRCFRDSYVAPSARLSLDHHWPPSFLPSAILAVTRVRMVTKAARGGVEQKSALHRGKEKTTKRNASAAGLLDGSGWGARSNFVTHTQNLFVRHIPPSSRLLLLAHKSNIAIAAVLLSSSLPGTHPVRTLFQSSICLRSIVLCEDYVLSRQRRPSIFLCGSKMTPNIFLC